MAKSAVKNNATRILEAANILYEVFTYSADFHTAEEVAEIIGAAPETVFKTLVVLPESGKGKPVLVLIPSIQELNLKKLGLAIGEKKVRMATKKEAESLTGLLIGGISPLALMQKGWKVYIDEIALIMEYIYVSGGQRGINIQVPPEPFIALVAATPISL
ncbi:YbaK/EbsC family protein [Candidatus Chlorohelix sp.]|uniref:YbaK/EbsC family protein n=1 Tax=Candidatus Chlorohelix sp. TaxID=3139201 RepID=UPI003031FC8A